jgi:hypothetical protein
MGGRYEISFCNDLGGGADDGFIYGKEKEYKEKTVKSLRHK